MAEIKKIPWEESIWIFDIDDTLSDTSDVSARATEGIRKVFSVVFGNKIAFKLQTEVNAIYDLMLTAYRSKHEDHSFDSFLEKVYSCQKQVKKQYGMPKKWSREIFVKMAADKLGLTVTPEIVSESVDEYWLELSRITHVFPDALKLMEELKAHHKPVYLMTSSDARLIMQPDGQFIYDPAYSEGLKRVRIELLREKGIDFDALSIGDPEDKPNLDFFQKGIGKIEDRLGKKIDLTKAIMAGDSFGGDLKTPKEKMTFGAVILVDRTYPHTDIVDEHQINTGDLSSVSDILISS